MGTIKDVMVKQMLEDIQFLKKEVSELKKKYSETQRKEYREIAEKRSSGKGKRI